MTPTTSPNPTNPVRLYAAQRLLEHGPLTDFEFVQITGWPKDESAEILSTLHKTGLCRELYQFGHRYHQLATQPA